MVTMETVFEGHLSDIFGNDNLPFIAANTDASLYGEISIRMLLKSNNTPWNFLKTTYVWPFSHNVTLKVNFKVIEIATIGSATLSYP